MSYEEEKQDRKIEQLEAEIERLRGEMENYGDDYVCQMKSKDARIKELEEALVEYQRLGKTVSEAVVPCLTAHGNCDQCRPKAKAACDAIETIRKGKIGADAAPRSWQITDERKAAIKELSELLTAIGCPSCHYYIQKNCGEDITVLRGMLEEVGQ